MILQGIINCIIFFLFGLLIGCLFEIIYRSIEYRKFVVPRFVNLQMYWLTSVFLFWLYFFWFPWELEVLLMIIFTTGIEFTIWYIYLRIKKIHLRNYSHQRANYKWIICPLFSLYWLLIAIIFYYIIFPWIIGFL